MRIVFMGTPDFAVPSLELLIENGYTPVAVVTAPDKRRGRGQKLMPTPIKKTAEAHGIPVLQPASVKDPDFAEALRALDVDVMVVVAFRILPPAVFEAARLGAFNLHGSILPAFRGAAPINRAVMAGVTETGVTTFFLKKKVDTGNIILKRTIPVGPDDTAGDVHDQLMMVGAEAVLETVRRIEAGTAEAQPQDDALATPAPKLFKPDMEIDWSKPAQEVHNHVRGLSPYPGAWTTHAGEQLKIFRTGLAVGTEGTGAPGTVLDTDGRLLIACGTGAVEVLEAQRAGKRRMPTTALLNGYTLAKGDRLG
ncbi:MAG: methionyl-tRNA formyltransferase [Bacteroidota bacterium]